MPSRFCIHYVSKSGRPSSGHRTGKGLSSSQFPKRAAPKNMLTTGQMHSSPMLVRSCLKSCMLGFRLQYYANHELPHVQAEFRKGRGTRDQIASIHWIKEKAKEFQKNIYLCFISYTQAFDYVDHDKLWKALKRDGNTRPSYCLLRNLYADKKAKVRILYGTTYWFKIEKAVWQGCVPSPCLFNQYAEHIMRNARLDELQAGIKTGRRNITTSYMQIIPL